MIRFRVGLFCVALLSVGGYFLFAQATGADANGRNEMAEWTPTPTTLRQQLQPVSVSLPSQTPDAAKAGTFFSAFSNRYRDHSHSVAVRGHELGHLMLKIGAQDPPWVISQIASSLWHEVRTDFGVTPEIEIFATYIGIPSRHIGSVRPLSSDPNKAHVVLFAHANQP